MESTHNIKIFNSPVVVFDLETTGPDAVKDRIVSIACSFLYPDGRRVDKHMLINPGIPIPEGATLVHGITDEKVKDKPHFVRIAKDLHDQIKNIDLAGFNIKGFDITMLSEEFARVGLDWPSREVKVYDAMGIFQNNERRRLQDAVKFYCKREITDAHDAAGDVDSTIDVLEAQIALYGFDSPDKLALHSRGRWEGEELVMRDYYDPAGKLYVDSEGDVCYNFGKNLDKKVRTDVKYAQWMLDGDFPIVTKRMLQRYLATMGKPVQVGK